MKSITFLGPVGATFSHDAYNILAEIYGAPKVINEPLHTNCIPASSNREVLKIIAQRCGYGTFAMETLAEGRVAEPIESFIELLQTYNTNTECPFWVVGSIRLKLHFCLMARKGIVEEMISKVVAHGKALGACRQRISSKKIQTAEVSSNGEAARLVAENDEYFTCAALGPKSAAEKYGLQVLDESYEDKEAVTTFFLIAPKEHKNVVGEENRILIVFRVPHTPGALVRALLPFDEEELNLIQIHSVHEGNGVYHFAIELDVKECKLKALERALEKFKQRVEKYLSFGPFEVLMR